MTHTQPHRLGLLSVIGALEAVLKDGPTAELVEPPWLCHDITRDQVEPPYQDYDIMWSHDIMRSKVEPS